MLLGCEQNPHGFGIFNWSFQGSVLHSSQQRCQRRASFQGPREPRSRELRTTCGTVIPAL